MNLILKRFLIGIAIILISLMICITFYIEIKKEVICVPLHINLKSELYEVLSIDTIYTDTTFIYKRIIYKEKIK